MLCQHADVICHFFAHGPHNDDRALSYILLQLLVRFTHSLNDHCLPRRLLLPDLSRLTVLLSWRPGFPSGAGGDRGEPQPLHAATSLQGALVLRRHRHAKDAQVQTVERQGQKVTHTTVTGWNRLHALNCIGVFLPSYLL